ncbi:hypothetical protein OHA72_22200 [Dactylosporangium sp. NBC_01737]|uniref:hypothetical protein n=1 Tax=Dactylosporangium sp. NBC_01737 TaxID=2975959 RepID=UPI002E12CF8B|nr:hypothetical protein OHA72_22200 [Dactylosporangium sp. NBC_01737]
MPNASTTLCDLLKSMADNLPSTASPDDPSVLQALVLAVRAATAAASGSAAEDWACYAEAIQHAVQALQTDLGDIGALARSTAPAGPDGPELRVAATELVKRLAELYATAAAGTVDSMHRRLLWSRVAYYLDDAAAELA